MPSDITGVNVFNAAAAQFRIPARADLRRYRARRRDQPRAGQDAVGAARSDAGVSGHDRRRDPAAAAEPFLVVATQNPIEQEGTYPLPEAQLDRFLLKIVIDYPGEIDERAMLKTMQSLGERSAKPHGVIQPVAGPEQLAQLRAQMHAVRVDDAVLEYGLRIIRQSRSLPSLTLGASPRAALMLLQAAKALGAAARP